MKRHGLSGLIAACAISAGTTAFAGTVFVREQAGACWQDGLFIGDGATGACSASALEPFPEVSAPDGSWPS